MLGVFMLWTFSLELYLQLKLQPMSNINMTFHFLYHLFETCNKKEMDPKINKENRVNIYYFLK